MSFLLLLLLNPTHILILILFGLTKRFLNGPLEVLDLQLEVMDQVLLLDPNVLTLLEILQQTPIIRLKLAVLVRLEG